MEGRSTFYLVCSQLMMKKVNEFVKIKRNWMKNGTIDDERREHLAILFCE